MRDSTDLKCSVQVLVNGVVDQLDALTHDPVAIKALADDLRASAPALGDAICEHAQPHKTATSEAKSPPQHSHHPKHK